MIGNPIKIYMPCGYCRRVSLQEFIPSKRKKGILYYVRRCENAATIRAHGITESEVKEKQSYNDFFKQFHNRRLNGLYNSDYRDKLKMFEEQILKH